MQTDIPLSQSNPLIRLVYASVISPPHRNLACIKSFVEVANERNPKLNVGGWLYVDKNLTNVEQVLEGPRSSVERLFYGRKVTDERGNLKGKESWVGGIYGDPAHSVKKAFQQEAAGSGGVRVYQHWGMSWAITTVTDDSNGGASRRLAKIVAKQPVYARWLGTGRDEDLEEDCDDDEDNVTEWVGKGERMGPSEGDVVEVRLATSEGHELE